MEIRQLAAERRSDWQSHSQQMLMSDWDNSTKQSKRMCEGSGPGSQHAWEKKEVNKTRYTAPQVT